MKRFYKFLMPLVAIVALALPVSVAAQTTCQIKIVGEDAYGDGWNGGSLAIMQGTTTVATFNAANADDGGQQVGAYDSTTVTVQSGTPVSFVWTSGSYDDEVTIWIYDGSGAMVFTVTEPDAGTIYTMNTPCPSCIAPAGLAMDSTSGSIDITWTAGNGTAWQIVWGTGIFNPDTVTVNTADVSTNSYSLGTLDAGQYTVYVRTDCGTDTSTWASVHFNIGVDVINMATSGTQTLTTCNAIIYDNGGSTGSYSNYCNATLILLPQTAGDYVVINGFSHTEGSWDYLTIYEGVGTTGDILFRDNTSGDNSTHTFGPFASDAFTVVFYSDGSNVFEGFQINVSCTAGPSCVRPATFTIESINPRSVNFSWEDTEGSAWAIGYGPAGFTLGDSTTSWADFTDTFGTVDNLTPETAYDFYLMSICGSNEGDTSRARMLSATTIPSCAVLTNVEATATVGSAIIGWTPSISDAECQALVEYRIDTADTWTTAGTTTGTSYVISGLDAGTNYVARLAALCANGDTSNWVTVTFSTGEFPCALADSANFVNYTSGTGTSQTSGVPVNSSWGNTLCQSIYLAREIAASGVDTTNGNVTITQLSFTWTNNSTYAKQFSIYMTNESDSLFSSSSASQWKATGAASLVYTGEHALNTSGTVTYTLSTPFVWDGHSNICVTTTMNQPTGASHTSSGFYGYSTATSPSAYRTMYKYQDSSPINGANITVSPSNRSYNRPNINFHSETCLQQATCAAPAAILNYVGADTVILSWIPGASETDWDIYVRAASDTAFTLVGNATNTEYVVSGLNPATEYFFRVVNTCNGEGEYISELNATTNCMPFPIPFIENFNGMATTSSATDINCWNHIGGGYVNITSGYGNDGNCLRFYPYSSSNGNVLVLPEMAAPISSLELMFNTRPEGTSSGSIGVGYVTDANNANSFVELANYPVSYFPTTSTWMSITQNFVGAPAGARIALRHNVNSTSWYWFIDDIEVNRYSTCPRVQNLNVTGVSNNSANISWQSPDSVLSYTLFWSTTNDVTLATDSIEVTEPNYALAGLAGNTTYYVWVKNVCDYEPSALVTTSFTTYPDCGAVEDLEVGGITNSAATVSWNANTIGNPSSAFVVKVLQNTTIVLDTVVTDNYVFLNGLDTLTTYSVTVRARCDSDSSAVATTSFTTRSNDCNIIGTGVSTSQYPVRYSTYAYSYMQVLYLADEMSMMADTINGITLTASVTDSVAVPLAVYVGQSDRTDLYTSTMLQPSEMALVYNDTMTFHAGACYIPFTTPYVRNNSRNLVIAFDNNMGASLSSLNFAYTSTSPTYMLNFSYGASDINPDGASATNVTSYRPNIEFDATCATCATPSIVVSGTTETSISLVWNGDATSYDVTYCAIDDTVWVSAATGLTATNYTINGLATGKQFYIKVIANCTDGSNARQVLCATACGDVAVPYVENFDYYANNDFTRPCWSYGDLPYVSNLVVHGPMLRLNSNYVVLPHFDATLNELQVRVKYVCSDTLNNPYVLFGYVTNPEDINSLVVVDTIDFADPQPTILTLSLGSLANDQDGYIAFYRPEQTSTYYSFFDDLIVEYIPACAVPDSVMASNVTTSTADISWYTESNMISGYRVLYKKYADNVFDTITTQNNTVSLSGLDHSTTYQVYVASLCDTLNDESSLSMVCQFNTECDDFTTLPYVQNFDNVPVPAAYATGVLPNCWTIVNTLASSAEQRPQIYYDNDYAYSGGYSLRMYYTSVVALPYIGTALDSLQVSFRDYVTSTDYAIVVGVVDSLNSTATFHPADTITFSSTGSHEVVTYMASAGVANGYIAFKNIYTGTYSYNYSYNYLDNIEVSLAPSCLPVTGITSILDSASSITLNWNDPRPATEWQIAHSTSALTDPLNGVVTTVTAHPYEVTGLSDDSNYYFYIRTVCGAGDSSEWTAYGPVRCHVVNMHANQTDTLYMCGGTLYDDGGPDNNYSASQQSYVVLMPSTPGALVTLNGTAFIEGNSWDNLYIYDGIGTSGTVLVSLAGQSYSSGTTVSATSSSGPLTVYFKSDGSVQYSGFALNVGCLVDPCGVSDVHVNVAASTSTSVNLEWTGTSTTYQIEYGVAGFAEGTGTTISSTSNSVVISGLTSLANYDFRVRGLCNQSDTGFWHNVTYTMPMCDNVVMVENFDSTLTTTGTSTYVPIGFSLYDYGYVQTIVDSAYMANAGLTGDITAFAFNAGAITTGSQMYENMTVFLANVSENNLSSGWILPNDSNHVFVKVIDSADFSFTESGWQIHNFDTAFTWDGHSNILVSVKRDNGDWDGSQTFTTHTHPVAKTRYAYRDNTAFDYTNPGVTGTALTTVGDLRFYSCSGGCPAPAALTTTNVTYNAATITWTGSDSTEVGIHQGLWDEAGATMTNVTPGVHTYTFTGLTPNTQYTAAARTLCEDNMTSNWTFVTFTTDDLPCFAPTNIQVSNETTNGGKITWTPGGNETEWIVNVFRTGIIDTNITVINTPMCNVSGLYAATTYTISVASVCGGIDTVWCDTTATLTTTACLPPTNVNAVADGRNAMVTWTSSGANEYHVLWYLEGFTTGADSVVVTNGTTNATITGLEPGEDYDIYVYAYCDGQRSAQAGETSVHITGIDDVNSSLINLYPNPANTTVTVDGIQGEALVTIVDMNGRTVYSEKAVGKLTIDLGGMAQGAYFVRITGENTTAIRKLIVK